MPYRSIFFWSRNTLQFSFCGLGMACRSKSGVSEYPTGQSAWSENALQVNFWGLTMPCRECPASQFVFAVSEAPAGQCSIGQFFWVNECPGDQFFGVCECPAVQFCLGLGMPDRSKWGVSEGRAGQVLRSENALQGMPHKSVFLRSQNALQFNVLQVSFWVVYECPTGHFWVCECPASQFLRSRNTPRVDFWGLGMVCRSIF